MGERNSFKDAKVKEENKFANCQLGKNIIETIDDSCQEKHDGAYSGGLAKGNYGTINKLYEEEKFHARQGHGFAAERANDLYDKLQGKDAKIVGDNNAKDGADRIVDGIKIQSKYCQSGQECIDACFENGKFRYYDNGRPMQVEVPSDMYDAAVSAMEEKIKAGQVDGVTNVEEAKNIVRKGHFTYEQVKNIAKAGTVESITYDAVNGAIIAASALGVTAALTFAASLWNGEDYKDALKKATYSGLKVGGTSFVTTVLASQLSKAGLNSALVGSSEAIVSIMGPKASAVLINAFRNGNNIYGAAAMKSAAKLLRGNVITGLITIGVFSVSDIAHIFEGKISGKQLFKNITNTTATVAGGTGGWLGGSAAGTAGGAAIGGMIGSVIPGAGTAAGAAVGAVIGKVVGGIAGSVGGGALAGKVSDSIVGKFIEDDAVEMVDIIQNEFGVMAQEFLLTKEEARHCVDALSKKLDGKILRNMYASEDKEQFARDLLTPVFVDETAKRQIISIPSNEQMAEQLKDVLEEIYEQEHAG